MAAKSDFCDDPDVRREPNGRPKVCDICRGPIYRDEKGHRCPDCKAGMDQIKAQRLPERQPPPEEYQPRIFRYPGRLNHDRI